MAKITKEEQKSIATVELYIKNSIEMFFPMRVKEIAIFDFADNGQSLIGVFEAEHGEHYSFKIDKDYALPTLQPYRQS